MGCGSIIYRGYYYDNETGWYYLQSRYYDPAVKRFINADSTELLTTDCVNLMQYNLFMYCNGDPVNGRDPSGHFDIENFMTGGRYLAVGITAIAVGVSVITCGIATPLMVGIAAGTIVAGTATTVNGVSECAEAFTDYNFMRDSLFAGNITAYKAYAETTAALSEIGTVVCGGWMEANKTAIADYKLQQIIDNPESVSKLSKRQFRRLADQSSWESGIAKNGKGYRAIKGDYSIRYSENGTRIDEPHYFGNPYWVVSSAAKGIKKVPF